MLLFYIRWMLYIPCCWYFKLLFSCSYFFYFSSSSIIACPSLRVVTFSRLEALSPKRISVRMSDLTDDGCIGLPTKVTYVPTYICLRLFKSEQDDVVIFYVPSLTSNLARKWLTLAQSRCIKHYMLQSTTLAAQLLSLCSVHNTAFPQHKLPQKADLDNKRSTDKELLT